MSEAAPFYPAGNPAQAQGPPAAASTALVVAPGHAQGTMPDQAMPPAGGPDQPMLAIDGPPPPAPHPPPEQLVRNLTADLQLPPQVDELLKEHSDFLFASGAAITSSGNHVD
jgi:hypothetical protein